MVTRSSPLGVVSCFRLYRCRLSSRRAARIGNANRNDANCNDVIPFNPPPAPKPTAGERKKEKRKKKEKKREKRGKERKGVVTSVRASLRESRVIIARNRRHTTHRSGYIGSYIYTKSFCGVECFLAGNVIPVGNRGNVKEDSRFGERDGSPNRRESF